MALLSELVATCADQRLDSAGTLNVFARRLREAGRISKAGRGRGAAHMTYLDAARFLIACAATDHPERAADAEYVFSNYVNSSNGFADSEFPISAEVAPTLDVALAKALEGLGDGSIDSISAKLQKETAPNAPFILPSIAWLVVPRNGGTIELRVLSDRHHFEHPALAGCVGSIEKGGYPVQKVAEAALERETYRFRTGKNLTAEFDSTLLRTVARLIAGTEEKNEYGR